VTSCEAESLFSTLKRIKTYLKNSIADNRQNGLAALNIHREIKVDTDGHISIAPKIAGKVRKVM